MKQILLQLVGLIYCLSIYAQIPDGYYSKAENKTGYELKTALFETINGHTDIGYDAVWNAFKTTDKKSNGKVWDMYSDIPNGTLPYEYSFGTNQCGNYSGEGSCYNREHSFPKSWFNDARPMHNDIFHLYPTDGYVNGKRSNYPFGEVGNPTWTSKNGSKLGNCSFTGYSSTVFEPIDEYKGDFARTYFYMATRYEDKIAGFSMSAILNNTANQVYKDWYLRLLFKWHEQDPVSQKEIDRNNAVYKIQKNRNPFIDHPEYAAKIWQGYGTTPEPEPDKIVLLNEQFNSGLGLFSEYSVTGNEKWINKTYNGNSFAEMNGYSNGTFYANEDWLISPPIELQKNYNNINLSFKTAHNFGNNNTTRLAVYILENYTPNSNPNNTSTIKTDITSEFQYSSGNYEWKESGKYLLDEYKQKTINIAFAYITTDQARLWRVDDVKIDAERGSTSAKPEVLNPITLYPNPAQGSINIESEGKAIIRVNIFNTQGIKLLTENCYTNKQNIRLDVLGKGIYIVEIVTEDNKSQFNKFIKR